VPIAARKAWRNGLVFGGSALALFGSCFLLTAVSSTAFAESWEETVSPFAPGSFPELRPLRANYRFGWGGLTAATAEVRLAKSSGDRFRLEGTGQTVGLARSLWKFDATHMAISDALTLRPIQVREVETLRAKKYVTDLTFTPAGVTSAREETRANSVAAKTRRFDFPNVLSLNSALLYLRTQPLPDGAAQRIVVYPATAPYLCTITALGREQLTVPTGTYDAIKLDLKLAKIGKKRALEPHKKFRRTTVWLSNDADRLVLRIEAQVFVGAIFAELESVQFEGAKTSM